MKSRYTKWLSFLFIFILASQSLVAGSAYAADEISKLVLNKNELVLQVGDTANLTATAIFVSGTTENATVKTDWNSGTTDTASVYAGVVTAKKEGKAVITATYMGKTEIVNVTVTKKVKSLTSNKLSLDLRLDTTEQLTITAYYDDGTSETVTSKADYTIDDSSIVSVTNGLVKGQNPGSATITVKYMNQSLKLYVDVEVVRRIDAEKSEISLLLNGTEKIKLLATYPDGTVSDVSEKAVWTSEKDKVADAIKGTIKGYSVGKTTLTASYGTKTTTIVVDVDSAVKLDLDKQNVLLKKDASGELKLTATYADNTTKDVSGLAEWASSDEKVVSVSKGKLIATSIGEATITAKYGDKTVSTMVDVEVPRRLVVDSDSLSLKAGAEQQLALWATYSDGTTVNVKDSAVWTVDDEAIVYVSKGNVKAYKAGIAKVTATYGGKTTTIKVEVDIPNIIKPSDKIVNLQIGGSKNVVLTAIFKDGSEADVSSKAEWTTSSKDIADVHNGYISGTDTGAATITAKYGTRTAVIQVSVGVLKSLTVNQDKQAVDKLVLKKGASVTLNATALYTDDTSKEVTSDVIWTSGNTKYVTVEAGKVKALASGETTITAQLDTKTISIPVQIDMASDLSANVTSLVFDLNETRSISLTAVDSDGAKRDVTSEAEWKSNSPTIALVTKGVVTGVSRGKTSITALYGGKSVSISVEIGVIQTLAADKSFIVTKSGDKVQVKLTATLADGTIKDVTEAATWKVQSYKLGTVVNGLFTATASGKTTLSGSFGGKMIAIPIEIDSLKYLKTDVVKVDLQEGKTASVEALATYTDGSEENVTIPALWTSSNIMIADVKDGVIKATGKGSARITISYSNMKTTVLVTVTK
ncbi:Ig-like domain-containing protein [Paenibacillus sp. N3.4]|uniref:Ig-like domain-containing protein n=1 Tax=Paenibacillus sp. N3.4 TaxID=2603222 RepID=UPI0011C70651|nr:Ig-like domain-containing protein [Paenibacillus sp. N3.4]TXK76100.1 hypothetical protein FU659_26250 [Paenibacillus sp. N3.4]